MEREFRIFKKAEIRSKKGAKPGIEGHAAVFNELSEDLGWYREKIMPGAFSDDLKTNPDIRALFNHDPSIILGRTKSGTLRVKEDNQGLAFDCDMPDTQAARDLMTSIDRGDVDQCSFGFRVSKQKWSEEPDPTDTSGQRKMIVREIHAAQVFDVSPVTYPAYPQTDVNARAAELRSMFPDGVPSEIREHVPELRDHKTKKVDGVELTASCFAFVGDKNNPSSWKLPINFPDDVEKTKSHIRDALARFNQTKGIPSGEKERVWHRVVGAAKAHGIHVSDEEDSRSYRSKRDAKDGDPCECDCHACQDGDCSDCSNPDCDDPVCAEDGCPMQDDDRAARQDLELRARLAAL